jgi:DNA-binding GntR family transcriptional regulator
MTVDLIQRKNPLPLTIKNHVLTAIREQILTGRLPLGSRIDQQAIAEELGVSVIPVRESLRQLEGEGLVQIVAYRGAFVARPSLADVEGIYLIREVLEELAVKLAVGSVSRESLRELRRLMAEGEQAVAVGDIDELLSLNKSFHFVIYTHSRQPLLVDTITGFWDRIRLYRQMYIYQPESTETSLREHEQIYRLIESGDADAAGLAMRRHLERAGEKIIAMIRESLDS